MHVTDMREDLGDYEFIPHRNIKGKTKIVKCHPHGLLNPVKGKKPADKLASSESSTSEVDEDTRRAEEG